MQEERWVLQRLFSTWNYKVWKKLLAMTSWPATLWAAHARFTRSFPLPCWLIQYFLSKRPMVQRAVWTAWRSCTFWQQSPSQHVGSLWCKACLTGSREASSQTKRSQNPQSLARPMRAVWFNSRSNVWIFGAPAWWPEPRSLRLTEKFFREFCPTTNPTARKCLEKQWHGKDFWQEALGLPAIHGGRASDIISFVVYFFGLCYNVRREDNQMQVWILILSWHGIHKWIAYVF